MLGSLYVRLFGGIALVGVLLYTYDYMVEKPIRDVRAAYEVKINAQVDEVLQKDTALKMVGGELNTCRQDLQMLKDLRIPNELHSIFRQIDSIELTGEEYETDDNFNLYHYSF